MKIPFRKPKLVPREETLYNCDTTLVPAIDMETVKTVHHEFLQLCACCGTIGATHQFVNGDLYLKRLEHNYLCDACHMERERARNKHNVANHKTVLTPAVGGMTDRVHNLAVEST